MAGPRTLIASLGASIALVAAAALSLLALSVVFAFGGWSGPLAQSADKPPLVFAESHLSDATGDPLVTSDRAPIVAPAPARRSARSDDRSSDAAGSHARRAPGQSSTSVSTGPSASMPNPGAPPAPPAAAPPPAPVAQPRRTGDHVRQIGNSLSSTVQKTGAVLADATQPLGPPVSAVVQQVLNLVADIVRRGTNGLGNTLDALLPK
jgi:hypothetical protein